MEFISLETIEQLAQQYGYWAVFFGILLENVGLPIPGESLTLAGGFLAGSQQLNYWLVLTDAALGAAIGGNLGYWVGRLGGWPLLLRVGKLLRVPENQLLGLKQQFSQNAVKAVFLGRFVALLRVFSSPLAGMVGMPYGQFFWVNALGALAWAGTMVTLSYFAGQVIPLERLAGLASQFAAGTLVVVAAIFVIPLWLESRKVKATVEDLDGTSPSTTPNEGTPHAGLHNILPTSIVSTGLSSGISTTIASAAVQPSASPSD